MSRSRSLQHRLGAAALGAILALAVLGAARPMAAQCDPENPPAPYVFFLLDTSGSLNWSPICTQTMFDNGQCSFPCPTGDCFVPLQGDDPASKLYQLKEALQTVMAGQTGVQFGLATFNQDQLNVRAKHWLYQAASNGPSIPSWGPFPATGAKEVFGLAWSCNTGSGDNQIGCAPTTPADLPDLWELTRVQRLPKGGIGFNQPVIFYVRQGTVVYKVTYIPAGGSVPGAASLTVNVRLDKCLNGGCTTTTLAGQANTLWNQPREFISWDNGSTSNTIRTNPELNYFTPVAADASATNTCSGWDPNTDSTADLFNGYNLRFPTDSSDPRGSFLYPGDVLPLDWQTDHNLDVQVRLAPNLAGNPGGTPDFRTSPYLADARSGSDTFLRLKNAAQRPLIAVGATPLGNSLASVSTWYTGWQNVAQANDPDFACRKKAVILLTDGDGTCSDDACTPARTLFQQAGVLVFAVGFSGVEGPQLSCIAANGGTSTPFLPWTKQDLIDDLNNILAALKAP
ncbi:MAG TPA: hypothetical protein VF173_28035 [Thermoanaerobaculia bacterium]|nr:hypothetical protein [Thermoanaerobaculia bacterium]